MKFAEILMLQKFILDPPADGSEHFHLPLQEITLVLMCTLSFHFCIFSQTWFYKTIIKWEFGETIIVRILYIFGHKII